MSLFDRLLEQHLQPAAAPKTKAERVVDGVELVPGLQSPQLLSEGRGARSNASFEARRAVWREEALAKMAPATVAPPPPAPPVAAPVALPSPRPSPPPAAPVSLAGPLVSRGSCKAINPETGRQCALLAGHTKLHRHGSTEFRFGAEPGQTFKRRDALDRLASSRNFTPATGE